MGKSKYKTDWKDEKPLYLVLALVGLIISIVFYFIPNDFYKIAPAGLVRISNLILVADPEVVTSRKGGERILLRMKNYMKPFQVAGFDFDKSLKHKIINDIKSGDTLTVKIDSSEFETIDKETLFESYIEIHSLKKNGLEYLDIKNANFHSKNDLAKGVPVGIYLMIIGLVYWSFKRRPMLSPTIIISVGLLILILMLL